MGFWYRLFHPNHLVSPDQDWSERWEAYMERGMLPMPCPMPPVKIVKTYSSGGLEILERRYDLAPQPPTVNLPSDTYNRPDIPAIIVPLHPERP